MALQPIQLAMESNPSRALAAGSSQLVNCYLEQAGSDAKAPSQIWADDGLSDYLALPGTDPIRGWIDVDGTLYAVAGRQVYSITANNTVTSIGGHPSEGTIYMERNLRDVPQIVIVSSDGVYSVIDNNVISRIDDTDLAPPTSLAYSDGFMAVTQNNGRWAHSNDNNAAQYDGLAYATAESNPDTVIRVVTKQREFVLFGTRSTEFWQNVGTSPFAYQRSQSIEIGCGAAGSVAKVEQTLMWVADDFSVRIMIGYQGQKVSTHAVDRAIRNAPDRDKLRAVMWRSGGHTFYALSSAAFTWVYNLTTGKWHNKQSYGINRWKGNLAIEFNGKILIADYANAKIYEMKPETFNESTDPLVVKIVTPAIHITPSRLRFNALYVDVVTGVGDTAATPETVTPELMMRYSDDGGITWSSEYRASIGKLGETRRRVVFRRLGMSGQQGRVFELNCSAAVVRGFLGASVDVDKLAA
jgi:hypothetical protein